MSETIDPITVLRDYFINKKEITVNTKAASGDDNVELVFINLDITIFSYQELNIKDFIQLVFGDSGIKLPRKVKTAWQRKDGKDYYNVGDIYFWLANSHLKPLEYMRDAQGQGFQVIQMNDRQEIQTYFSGASNSSNQIDEQYRPQTLIKKSHLRSSRAVPVANLQGQAGQVLMRKRDAKAEEKIQQKMKVFEHLLQNERKISSRATAIQSQNRSFLKVLQLAYQMTGQEKKVQEVQVKSIKILQFKDFQKYIPAFVGQTATKNSIQQLNLFFIGRREQRRDKENAQW